MKFNLKVKQESALSAHKQKQEKRRVSFPASQDVSICISASNAKLGLSAEPSKFFFLF